MRRHKRRPGQRRRGRVSRGQGDCHAGRKNSVPYSWPAAVDFGVPLVTNLQVAERLVEALELIPIDQLKVRSWSRYGEAEKPSTESVPWLANR